MCSYTGVLTWTEGGDDCGGDARAFSRVWGILGEQPDTCGALDGDGHGVSATAPSPGGFSEPLRAGGRARGASCGVRNPMSFVGKLYDLL